MSELTLSADKLIIFREEQAVSQAVLKENSKRNLLYN